MCILIKLSKRNCNNVHILRYMDRNSKILKAPFETEDIGITSSIQWNYTRQQQLTCILHTLHGYASQIVLNNIFLQLWSYLPYSVACCILSLCLCKTSCTFLMKTHFTVSFTYNIHILLYSLYTFIYARTYLYMYIWDSPYTYIYLYIHAIIYKLFILSQQSAHFIDITNLPVRYGKFTPHGSRMC